jgi:hypothetical protein
MNKMEENQNKSSATIPTRFRLIAEGVISQKELRNLTQDQVKIFLTESDPNKWPVAIMHLKKYVRQKTDA